MHYAYSWYIHSICKNLVLHCIYFPLISNFYIFILFHQIVVAKKHRHIHTHIHSYFHFAVYYWFIIVLLVFCRLSLYLAINHEYLLLLKFGEKSINLPCGERKVLDGSRLSVQLQGMIFAESSTPSDCDSRPILIRIVSFIVCPRHQAVGRASSAAPRRCRGKYGLSAETASVGAATVCGWSAATGRLDC